MRHTPTLYGVAFYPDLYWDGRAKGLEAQIVAAWKGQMGADPDQIAKDLEAIPAYKDAFETELGGPPTGDRIVKALASFVRTIHAATRRGTRWTRRSARRERGRARLRGLLQGGAVHAVPPAAALLGHALPQRRRRLEQGEARPRPRQDPGGRRRQGRPAGAREAETLQGAFKTPTLRGAALSGPYFHDGSAATLEAAVDFMVAGGTPNPHLDPKLKPARLSAKQRADLIEFLKSLTPDNAPYTRPTLP